MNSLISINSKFMDFTPKRLVELIMESKYTKGVEMYVNIENKEELKYLDDLVFELKKNSLILQIHGDIGLNFEKQIEFMKKLENYSDYLNMPIVVTMHTIYDKNQEISINKTVDYLTRLVNSIDSEKIIISLENLNDMRGYDRLNKLDIRKSVLNDEKIYFTYDIGHEIIDFGNITDLDQYMIDDIRNIHIHSHNDRGVDHMPIYKTDKHWNEIIKGLTFLVVNNYKYNIVYEYGLEYCNGNNKEEQIKDYLSSIDFVSERYNK